MYHSQCLNQTYASALYLILTCKDSWGPLACIMLSDSYISLKFSVTYKE